MGDSKPPAKPPQKRGGGGTLPASIRARLQGMGCSGDDFKLILCARPKINAYCQNMRANGATCQSPRLASAAQACLNASGTDAPIGNALAAQDKVSAATNEASSRGLTALSKARMICNDPNAGHAPGTPGSVECGGRCQQAKVAKSNRDSICYSQPASRLCKDLRTQYALAINSAATCRCH